MIKPCDDVAQYLRIRADSDVVVRPEDDLIVGVIPNLVSVRSQERIIAVEENGAVDLEILV